MDNLKPKELLLAMIFGAMVVTCLLFYSFVYAENDYSASNAAISESNASQSGRNADIAAQQTRQYTAESAQPTGWAIQSEANASLGGQYADITAQQTRQYTAESAQPAKEGGSDFLIQEVKAVESNNSRE
ncbi:MAG: hypothetical protein NTZ92_00415 [Candidatus Omnitrophica bacterium]|nr:hypothetical protein [Candidatus Omnitrophota bacterium]